MAITEGIHREIFEETPDYYAVWSTDAGQTWPAFANRKTFFPIGLYASSDYASNEWPGDYRLPLHSDAALDPTTGDFYIVISGRRAEVGQPGANNLDLYIIRGRTNNPSTPIVFDQPVRLELDPTTNPYTDGPDQFMPSITVDDLGGIDLVYYDTRNNHLPDNSAYAKLDAYFARITGFGTGNQAIFRSRLTPSVFCTECENCGLPPCPYEQNAPNDIEFMGDYIYIDSHGCDIDLIYTSTQSGRRHEYMHRIDLCAADADDNLSVNASDPGEFQLLYSQGSPKADLNQDGVLDSSDYVVFTEAYTNAPK